ncbi:hypothetical protein VTO73DRAFT_10641 [Trametes versicolor]
MPLPSRSSSLLDTSPNICTRLNPSQERIYILSESTLLHAIEQGQLPFFHDPAIPFTHNERSGNAPQDEVVQEASNVQPEVSLLFPVVSPTSPVQTTDASAASEGQRTILHLTNTDRRARQAACESCYQARKRCGGQRPCPRCKRMHLPCVPRNQLPRKARAPRVAEDPAVHAPQQTSGEPSGTTHIQYGQVNAGPGFFQAASCFPVWCPGSDRYDSEGVDALLSQIAASSSDVTHPEYPAYIGFGHTSGGYAKPPT